MDPRVARWSRHSNPTRPGPRSWDPSWPDPTLPARDLPLCNFWIFYWHFNYKELTLICIWLTVCLNFRFLLPSSSHKTKLAYYASFALFFTAYHPPLSAASISFPKRCSGDKNFISRAVEPLKERGAANTADIQPPPRSLQIFIARHQKLQPLTPTMFFCNAGPTARHGLLPDFEISGDARFSRGETSSLIDSCRRVFPRIFLFFIYLHEVRVLLSCGKEG